VSRVNELTQKNDSTAKARKEAKAEHKQANAKNDKTENR
jgi:hypothetical protein